MLYFDEKVDIKTGEIQGRVVRFPSITWTPGWWADSWSHYRKYPRRKQDQSPETPLALCVFRAGSLSEGLAAAKQAAVPAQPEALVPPSHITEPSGYPFPILLTLIPSHLIPKVSPGTRSPHWSPLTPMRFLQEALPGTPQLCHAAGNQAHSLNILLPRTSGDTARSCGTQTSSPSKPILVVLSQGTENVPLVTLTGTHASRNICS